MTDDNQGIEQGGDEPIPFNGDADWFLQSIVEMVNSSDMEIGITVQVAGFLVSGMMVSGPKFFTDFGEKFGSAFEGEVAESIKKSYAGYGAMYDNPDEKSIPKPSYIHLKDARFFISSAGHPIPTDGGTWWRGRLSEVSGFFLGNMTAS